MEIRNRIYKFEVDNKETGKYIKQLRKERGWTAEILAEKLYCSPKTISSWETGVRMPSLDMLISLSEIFNVSIHSLLLPLDNCPCDFIGYFPNIESCNFAGVPSFADDSDDVLSKVFIRKEYLLQRAMCGVYTQKDKEEMHTIICSLGGNNRKKSEFLNLELKNYEDFELAFFKQIANVRSNEIATLLAMYNNITVTENNNVSVHEIFVIFSRLYCGMNLDKTIRSMGIIEKSILFTVSVLCKEIRKLDFIKKLYEAGGRFIKDILKNAPNYFIKAIIEEIPYRIINNGVYYCNVCVLELSDYNNIIRYLAQRVYNTNADEFYNLFYISHDETIDQYLDSLKKDGQIYE